MTQLTLRGITVHYGRDRALDNVDLAFPATGLVVIAGPNGSGKSTLLDVIAGVVMPSAGCIAQPSGETINRGELRRHVARLHQRTVLPYDTTVSELLGFAAQYRRTADLWVKASPPVLGEPIAQLLGAGGIDAMGSVSMERLSGGQQRLCMVAATLLTDRRILLFDEPLAGLAPSCARIFVTLAHHVAETRLVVIVDHESQSLHPIAERIVLLDAGRIVGVQRRDGEAADG